MTFCRFCGTRTLPDASFCGVCGHSLELPAKPSTITDVMPQETRITANADPSATLIAHPRESVEQDVTSRERESAQGERAEQFTPLPIVVQQPASGHIPIIQGTPQPGHIPTLSGTPQSGHMPTMQGTPGSPQPANTTPPHAGDHAGAMQHAHSTHTGASSHEQGAPHASSAARSGASHAKKATHLARHVATQAAAKGGVTLVTKVVVGLVVTAVIAAGSVGTVAVIRQHQGQAIATSASALKPTPTSPPNFHMFVGTWTMTSGGHGGGDVLIFPVDGKATIESRTYQWCDQGASPPCDSIDAHGNIIDGNQDHIVFSRIVGSTAYGVITSSTSHATGHAVTVALQPDGSLLYTEAGNTGGENLQQVSTSTS